VYPETLAKDHRNTAICTSAFVLVLFYCKKRKESDAMDIAEVAKDISYLLGDRKITTCCQLETTGQRGVYRLRIGFSDSKNNVCGLVQVASNPMYSKRKNVPKLLKELKQGTKSLERSKKHAGD
jgi:hypothetical protein